MSIFDSSVPDQVTVVPSSSPLCSSTSPGKVTATLMFDVSSSGPTSVSPSSGVKSSVPENANSLPSRVRVSAPSAPPPLKASIGVFDMSNLVPTYSSWS